MAKELTCEITKEYGQFDENEYGHTKVCEIKWGGRTPKGYDIRKYDKESQRMLKGINVTYDGITDLVKILVSNGLCDNNVIKECIKKREESIFDTNDFVSMFNKMNDEESKYIRDKYGKLRTEDGFVVISRRRKKK